MLARPAIGLIVVVEGLAEAPVGALPLAGRATPDSVALSALRRAGLSRTSIEVVAPWLEEVAISAPAVHWDAASGSFFRQPGSAPPADLTGRLACTAAGRASLAELGVRVLREGPAACPVFVVPVRGPSTVAATTLVELDAAGPAEGLALSEAALLVAVARLHAPSPTSAVDAAGVTVHRVYASGPAAVSAARGRGSRSHEAASAVLEAAVRVADRLLGAAVSPGRCVTVVLGAGSAADGENDGVAVAAARLSALARALEGPGTTTDANNIAPVSPTPLPARIAVTYSSTDIDAYHIVLWTSVILGLALLAVVYVMLGMDSARDPQLTAQIQDPRAAAAAGQRRT